MIHVDRLLEVDRLDAHVRGLVLDEPALEHVDRADELGDERELGYS